MADTVVIGIVEMNKRLFNLQRALPEEIKQALIDEAKIELTEAQKRTPVKTGALKASGHLEDPTFIGHETAIQIVFGTDLTYAIYVHEDLEAHHDVGQAKFLESVLLESEPYMLRRVANRINFNRLIY